ncbi:MAG: cobaltochelatase subunit CobN [Geminicoccaceae bacterium]
MHLLSAELAPLADAETAVDLGQTPGDILVLSAADSELACLAAARARLPAEFPSLRLANLLRLGHPMSVDLHVEKVAAHAKLIAVRLLGGRSYWPYGVDQLVTLARAKNIKLALLPGDDRPDPQLDGLSTLDAAARDLLWRCLTHGGVANAETFLRQAAVLLGRSDEAPEPRPLPKAGLHLASGPAPDLASFLADLPPERPRALLVFYRALVQAGDVAPVDALLTQLEQEGLAALGLYVASLKDAEAAALTGAVVQQLRPDVILTATGFALGSFDGAPGPDPLQAADCPILQVVLGSGTEAAWRESPRGLTPRDLAMQVALPEVDGRVLARAVSFKAPTGRDALTEADLAAHRPVPDRVAFTAELASAWAKLRHTPLPDRRVAILLANYPSRDGRLANGVGLDTPASCIALLRAVNEAGYAVADIPPDGDALICELSLGVTNDLAARADRIVRVALPLAAYREHYAKLPEAARSAMEERWGPPESDPALQHDVFPLPFLVLGNAVVGIQPARGYEVDPTATYHSPDLVPPHNYLAAYFWLRRVFGAHAIVHLGKHGNLEWLPGKALALTEGCWPEIALGPLPHLYPFIVNDPGEGSQAKRRAAAVIVDHLTPPLTRAGTYGDLRALELQLDEFHQATELDPKRAAHLRREIAAETERLGLARDLDLDDPAENESLQRIDAHLCELKELQIRDGLHILGTSPAGTQRTDLLVALARLPRGRGQDGDASLLRALAADLGLDGFDPLGADLAEPWSGPRPAVLDGADPWRTNGDTVERLEALAANLVERGEAPAEWPRTQIVLDAIRDRLGPALDASDVSEIAACLAGLDGRFVAPGPSGAPTRGRPEVLPTGRNFFSVDCRAVPTPTAWALGWKSAQLVVEHHLQTEGEYPRHVALSAWGTANMRTGGDDIAQALALLGCRPVWEPTSGRVTGVEVLPLSILDRPRVDVTFRVSGFFRDAFPAQIELLDDAVRAVAALDEPADMNPLADAVRRRAVELTALGLSEAAARRSASARVFGSKPGAYGAGLQAPIDTRGWKETSELAETYLAWSGWAYGRGVEGTEAGPELRERLGRVSLVLHNQDNREHDILDSDDYYQFEGGIAAAVRHLSGRQPTILHNDHSRPEHPRVRTLKDEIGRIVRGRAANPKWIAGVMRHGYKGAFEIAATVDYLFAFAATAAVVEDHHFERLFEAYLLDEEVRDFIARHNPAALREIAERFAEAVDRRLWRPARNSAVPLLESLAA